MRGPRQLRLQTQVVCSPEKPVGRPKPKWKPPCYVLPYPIFDGFPKTTGWGYGNWCGQGRPGLSSPTPNPKPIDPLDACCRCHDQDLGTCACGGYSNMAHTNLIECAKKADCSLSGDPRQCNRARFELIKGIKWLLNHECKGKEKPCLLPPNPCSPSQPKDCPAASNHSPCTY